MSFMTDIKEKVQTAFGYMRVFLFGALFFAILPVMVHAVNFTITASTDVNGSITPSGAVSVVASSTQNFAMVPNAGYHVADVLVDGTSAGAVTTYDFTNVSTDHTIAVSYAIDQFAITGTVGANGTISTTSALVDYGTNLTVTITPDAGYDVATITIDSAPIATSTSFTFTNVTASHTIDVTFVALGVVSTSTGTSTATTTHVITATAGANGNISPAGTTTVTDGTDQTFTITPDAGYDVATLSVDGTTTATSTTYTFTNVIADHTIDATFVLLSTTSTSTGGGSGGGSSTSTATTTHIITATAGANGTISPAGTTTVTDGTDQTFTITPDTGYIVATLVIDGATTSTSTTYTFNSVTATHTIAVTFTGIIHNIAITSGPHGVVWSTGTTSVFEGTDFLVNIIPDAGYTVDALTIDGATTTATTSYTFTNVTASHTLSATFIALHNIVTTAGVGGAVSPLGTTTVTDGSNQTFTITPNAGYVIDTLTIDGATTTTTTSYTFTNVTASHTLSATFIALHTIVATAGVNGSIVALGTTTVLDGATQTFTITPNAGYDVSMLVIDGTSTATSTTYTFNTITADHTIHATFIALHTIVATSGPNGTISPVGTSTVVDGAGQTYTITPSSGHDVATLMVDGTSTATSTTYTFNNVTGNHTIQATFIALHNVIVTAGPNGVVTNTGTSTLTQGSNFVTTVTANPGYAINVVTVDGSPVVATSTYSFLNVSAPHTINVTFIALHDIVVTAGVGGTVSPLGTTTVTDGANQTFTITPNAGYAVATLVVDGTTTSTSTSYTFNNITGDHTVQATFIALHNIVTTAGVGGTVSPLGTTTVTDGSNQTFTITPNAGYIVASLSVDGVSVPTTTTIQTFNNITTDHTITATFIPIYSVVASAGPNGNITPVGTSTVVHGNNQAYVITPAVGYGIATLRVDGVVTTATTTYGFVNVQSNHTIDVTFVLLPTHIIMATAGANGNITPVGTTSVIQGTNQTFTITPAYGYAVGTLTIDGATTTQSFSHTFVNVQGNHIIDVTFVALAPHVITATAGTNGTISQAGATTVYDTYNQTYTITPSFGFKIATMVIDGTSTIPSATHTFVNVQGDHTIDVTFAPLPIHTITAAVGVNGSISPTGATSVFETYSQTYTITPNNGYSIATLTVDGTPVATAGTYTFTNVLTNHTIDATFTLLPVYVVTATAGTNGTISQAGGTNVIQGQSQTYTITPDVGYAVGTLVVDGVTTTPTTTVTFTNVTTPHTIDVTFVPLVVRTITATAGTNGIISSTGTTSVFNGYGQTYTITPDVGYAVGTLVVDGVTTTATTSYTFTNVTADHTIDVTFVALPVHTIVANAGSGGTISNTGTTSVFQTYTQSFTITPDVGYGIGLLVIDGVTTTPTTTYAFTNVNANHTVDVTFIPLPVYTITASTQGNGGITPSGVANVYQGDSVTYSFAPNGGYTLDTITVDGVSVPVNPTYTFTNIQSTHTIDVSFTRTSSGVTYGSGGGSSKSTNKTAHTATTTSTIKTATSTSVATGTIPVQVIKSEPTFAVTPSVSAMPNATQATFVTPVESKPQEETQDTKNDTGTESIFGDTNSQIIEGSTLFDDQTASDTEKVEQKLSELFASSTTSGNTSNRTRVAVFVAMLITSFGGMVIYGYNRFKNLV